MARVVRSIGVPWPVLVALVGLVAIAWIQGLRMAADRSERLRPHRTASVTLQAAARDSVFVGDRFANLDLGPTPPARVGLYQILPERPLVRWVEDSGTDAGRRRLVIPLEGLSPGVYAVCSVDPDASAGPVEMDRPAEELDELGRFRVVAVR